MADVNRGNRPLSPFMLGQIYRLQLTSLTSLMHRVTGVGLTLGGVLVVWWLLAAASSAESFAFIDGVLTSWLGGLVMIGLLAALWYHFCNGVRHLFWDAGYGYEIGIAEQSGYASIAATAALTVVTLIAAFV
jgi:succinate dehydrogenase / fumarate reductase cytochrome b subunit